ncbi:MAG TPA: FG-GAP-like repeat-containing protein [Vicinamibacterales bacterium]|nr:FG-GAP-like repeat-containing protein [Vicinamibacterales bacterium]
MTQFRVVAASLALATIVGFAREGQGVNWLVAVSAAAAEDVAAAAQTLSFTDITAQAGMASSETGGHGAAWADATGDGRPDLYLTYNECRSGERSNQFFRNLGGVFVEEAQARGIANRSGGTHGGAWADLDNDGDYDLLNGDTYEFACPQGLPDPPPRHNRVFLNSGGVFADVTPPVIAAHAAYTRAMFAFDMEGDGDLDIFAVNGDRGSLELFADRNEVYRNESAVGITPLTTGPLATTPAGQAGIATDYDGDGDIDILLANFTGPLGVVRNDGGGIFTAVAPTDIGIFHTATHGISSGDLNNDGHLDLILIDQDRRHDRPLGYDRVAFVYLNTGAGTFGFHGEVRLFGGFTAGLADLDNDGDLDLVFPGLPFVLLNDGQAGFTPGPAYPTMMPPAGCSGAACQRPDPRTVAFADIDGDGDLDSVVTAKFAPFRLIRNNFNGGNWLKVRLVSPQGQAGAFGAKVRVFRAGTTTLIGMREAQSTYGYLSQDDPVIHLGLGESTTVDIEVVFLDGTRVTRQNVVANRTVAFIGTTSVETPLAPDNLAATVTGALVTLAWEAPAGESPTGYDVEVGSVPALSNLAIFQLGSTPSMMASAPNGTYYIRVRARNAAGRSAPSNEVAVTVGPACPAAPSGLAFAVSDAHVTLTWQPPGGETPLAYIIEAGSSAGAADLAILDTGAPATSLSAVAPPGTYYVRVRGRNACGAGAASNEVVIDVS